MITDCLRSKRITSYRLFILTSFFSALCILFTHSLSLAAIDQKTTEPTQILSSLTILLRPAPSPPPIIHKVACMKMDWQGESSFLFLAEVTDDTGAEIPSATAWVETPTSLTIELEYDPALKVYSANRPLQSYVGEYLFFAKVGNGQTVKKTKTITSTASLAGINITDGCPNVVPDEPLVIEWDPISGAAGYFVELIEEDSNEFIWANRSSVFSPLPLQTSITIPGGMIQSGKKYRCMIFGINNDLAEDASALSGTNLTFTPGMPFDMRTSALTTTTPADRWIHLSTWVQDCFGNDIDLAQVWATYPTGQQVPFIHDINGWYWPAVGDRPEHNLAQHYGTYTFHVDFDSKQMDQSQQLYNDFLPAPTNAKTVPSPLIRGQAFQVTWDAVPGATVYRIDIDEGSSGKIIYQTENSGSPSHTVPAETWNHLTPGNHYKILTHSIDKNDFDSGATKTSFTTIDFWAP